MTGRYETDATPPGRDHWPTTSPFDANAVPLLVPHQFLGAILHELQQPLIAIKLFALNGQRGPDPQVGTPDDTPDAQFAVIYDSAILALDTIAGLRRLANGLPIKLEWVDVNRAVAEVMRLAEIVGRARGITIAGDFESGLAPIWADRVSFQHVILNLLLNGVEAIGDQDERQVTVVTRSAAEMIEIVVADSGVGITEDHRDRLFDVNFTTKAEGSGLGLAIARSIVTDHGGTIELAPASPGEQTRFRLRLPLPQAPMPLC